MKMMTHFFRAFLLLPLILLVGCFAKEVDNPFSGDFSVQTVTVENNDTWQLNRPIVFIFNHPIDPASVTFGSVILKPVSSEVLGYPVTGQFEVGGEDDRSLTFVPACPTNETNDNGGFIPGGYEYQLIIPTLQNGLGETVLRDQEGRPLSVGLTRVFFTPVLEEPLFIDTVVGPPKFIEAVPSKNIVPWTSPEGLNLFTYPDSDFVVVFDQPIDTSASNLNTDRLYILFSETDGTTFPVTNKISGEWLVIDNCSIVGPSVRFRASGPLPPDRAFQLVMTTSFEDLSGERNNVNQTEEDSRDTPTSLTDIFSDTQTWASTVAFDEFQEDFENTLNIDLTAGVQTPLVDFGNGFVQASFDFPYSGEIDPLTDNLVVSSGDFHVLGTNGNFSYQDSSGNFFTLVDGLLKVHNLTIAAGGTLKGEGTNPLIVYATGTVTIAGTLDAGGNDAQSPAPLGHPEIVEVGALGHCGGGNGGSASQETDKETLQAENGQGAFGTSSGGGIGGEGGVQQIQGVMDLFDPPAEEGETWDGMSLFGSGNMDYLLAAGGGGGAFALTQNQAVQWARWSDSQSLFVWENGFSVLYDDHGPDNRPDRHSSLDLTQPEFQGAEAGLRGSSFDSNNPFHNTANETAGGPVPAGVYGMKDGIMDQLAEDQASGWDPSPDAGVSTFNPGHSSDGPDGGFGGSSPFQDGLANDYWGKRVSTTGAVVDGELTMAWAGGGGGGGGDLSVVEREIWDSNVNGIFDSPDELLPMMTNFPDPDFPAMSGFPHGWTRAYFKGAAGGGGGGQLLLFALGEIVLADTTVLKVNGGCGAGGEHALFAYNQVSGSGGGAGGHMVLHSNTGLNLENISVGTPADIAEFLTYDFPLVQAIGGRRGWSATSLGMTGTHATSGDGNSDYMAGRGGAGANGVIQIHVPNPGADISFHPNVAAGIAAYVAAGGPADYVNTDRMEQVLGVFSSPPPIVCVPFFDSESMLQSNWLDSGTALLRRSDAVAPEFYPKWSGQGISMAGLDGDGRVTKSGANVAVGTIIAFGSSGATVDAYEVLVPNISTKLLDPSFEPCLANPHILIGYDYVTDAGTPFVAKYYEIAAATYDEATDTMTLIIDSEDGPIPGAGSSWAIAQKFFRFDTADVKDTLPALGYARVEFRGADELGADPTTGVFWSGQNIPGVPTDWTTDLADLEGKRFFQYRISFDIAESGGISASSPRPKLKYFKIPYGW